MKTGGGGVNTVGVGLTNVGMHPPNKQQDIIKQKLLHFLIGQPQLHRLENPAAAKRSQFIIRNTIFTRSCIDENLSSQINKTEIRVIGLFFNQTNQQLTTYNYTVMAKL